MKQIAKYASVQRTSQATKLFIVIIATQAFIKVAMEFNFLTNKNSYCVTFVLTFKNGNLLIRGLNVMCQSARSVEGENFLSKISTIISIMFLA